MSYIYDIDAIRKHFPILKTTVYGKPLVYFDNGATTQKPDVVINTLVDYYQQYNANVHRGVHFLSQKATDAQEDARQTVKEFINAAHDYEIIFTKGTTDSINTICSSFGEAFIHEGDEVIVTMMEHHSNFVPWQMMCERRKAKLVVVPITAEGALNMDAFESAFTSKTKIVACTWVSNTLGTINDIKAIVNHAHAHSVPVMVDAAQAIQHIKIDVQALDIDFLVFSGHKIYGPTGIGVLYGKAFYLNVMPPYQGGGSMIKTVTVDSTTYADLPFKFEAGTPDVSGIIGLGAALKFVDSIGIEAIASYEHELITYTQDKLLAEFPNIRIYAEQQPKAGALSIAIGNIHPFDIGELLDKQGVAVRTGHHCCQPIMDYYEIPGTLRISFGLYNTKEDVDVLINALKKAILLLS